MDLTGRYSNPRDPLRRLAELELCADNARGEATSSHAVAGQPRFQRRLTPEDRAKLVAARQTGATVRELAEQFGIHRTTVAAHLQREGIATHRGGLRADDLDEVVRLYEQGWSARKLAKRFEVSDHTIAAELRRTGVQVRTRRRTNQR